MKHQKAIEKLQQGQAIDLPWMANCGKNIGYRIWVDKCNNAVFTEMDTGVNYEVIPLSETQQISDKIEDYIKQGYGL